MSLGIDKILFEQLASDAGSNGIQQLVVGAVIEHEAKVLLLQRPADDFMGGIYELPSGKVEPGEALDAALAREVKEETGLDLDRITHYLGLFDYTSATGKPTRQYNFAVNVISPGPRRC